MGSISVKKYCIVEKGLNNSMQVLKQEMMWQIH